MWKRFVALLWMVSVASLGVADDPVFSGPQVGEPLTPFNMIAVYGDQAGQEVDPIAQADGKPQLLVFVHQLTRPGMALTRGLTNYAKSLSGEGAQTAIIWLDKDKAQAQAYLNRARTSLNFTVPVGVSVDGGEGPGAYGLNRNVELTILIAKDNQVTANFALVQPSVTEGAAIAGELAKLVDKPAPTQEEFAAMLRGGREMNARSELSTRDPKMSRQDNPLREMMQGVVGRDADPDKLEQAVAAIDKWAADNPERQSQLGRMASAALQRGMGSARAQEALRKWQKEYASETELAR